MQISQSVLTAAEQAGKKALAASKLPGERLTRVKEIVELLAKQTSPAAQRGARQLLDQMSELLTSGSNWRVIRGAHRSRLDPTEHVLIEVAGSRYHLRLDSRGVVFDITHVDGGNTERLAGSSPWTKPGAQG